MVYPGSLISTAATTLQFWGKSVKVQQEPPLSETPPPTVENISSSPPNVSALPPKPSGSPVDLSPCTSEEDDDLRDQSSSPLPEITGKLFKWTNYFHGWQERFIALRNGCLSYYKSPSDQNLGCRGALNIRQAMIQAHEFDNCRFDVIVNENIWYLRAESTQERDRWISALQDHKSVLESGYGSEGSLRRHGSILSLTSAQSASIASSSSHKTGKALQEKLAEMETFKEILTRQVDTLQNYFDTCAEAAIAHKSHSHLGGGDTDSDEELEEALARDFKIPLEVQLQHAHHGPDFKGEAITFRATTSGLLETLRHCLELMSQREESLKRRLEKEVERRKRTELMYRETADVVRNLQDQLRNQRVYCSPDYEEGPQSAMKEDEFFDAVETTLDRVDKELDEEQKKRADSLSAGGDGTLKTQLSVISPAQADDIWEEIEHVTSEQFKYALLPVGEGGWQLFNEDGEMKMYKREEEKDGLVVDPLKAQHCVRGFTAHEMCHYFFSPDFRMEWEFTVDHMKVVEKLRDDTMIFHQIHKRIWPAAQRDALFWSHIRKAEDATANKENTVIVDDKLVPVNSWIVCNHSAEVPPIPLGKCLRVILTISLTCQTFIDVSVAHLPRDQISRDQITTKITYCATVNPGGWAPSSVLRTVYKREYPRFLKRFTQYVTEQTQKKPVVW